MSRIPRYSVMERGEQIQVVKELSWTEKELPQKERTKHVHSIHQYMGKYVPQLVDYFLERDLRHAKFILDPFAGSGTTLVQSNIHGIPSIGIDVSEFNVLLCNVKVQKYDVQLLKHELEDILLKTTSFGSISLDDFTKKQTKILETKSDYLKKWYAQEALEKLLIFQKLIPNYKYQDVLKIILSRAARSSRMATHFELDFPKKPQTEDYYCHKHSRICHPTTNSMTFIKRYCKDVLRRITEFQNLRNDVYTKAFCADSKTFDFSKHTSKIDGVITSPPYVGLIDYHEQHRYAYELLDIDDNSDYEIGKKKHGTSKRAVEKYKSDITEVFKNIANNVLDKKNGNIVVVVNDRLNLYEDIMNNAGLGISKRLKRQVDRRTGRRSTGFYEDIIIWNAKR